MRRRFEIRARLTVRKTRTVSRAASPAGLIPAAKSLDRSAGPSPSPPSRCGDKLRRGPRYRCSISIASAAWIPGFPLPVCTGTSFAGMTTKGSAPGHRPGHPRSKENVRFQCVAGWPGMPSDLIRGSGPAMTMAGVSPLQPPDLGSTIPARASLGRDDEIRALRRPGKRPSGMTMLKTQRN